MLLGQETIAVPFEELGGDPTSFDPNYRAKVAEALSSGFDEKKLPDCLKDKQTLQHARFLKEYKTKGDVEAVFAKYPLNGLAMNWAAGNNGSVSKHYIQALLLTDQPLKIVSEDLQLDEKAIKLYCDLYFACRSEKDGYEMTLPMETRLAFAFGEVSHETKQLPSFVLWRVIAVRDGYTALVRHWGTEKFAHGTLAATDEAMARNMWLANANMEQQLRAGLVGFRSLVELQNAWLGQLKMQEASDERDGTSSPLFELVTGILNTLAPKLASQSVSPEEKKATAQASKKKRLAEKNIESHNPVNAKTDKTVAAEFNKLKKEKFKLIEAQAPHS